MSARAVRFDPLSDPLCVLLVTSFLPPSESCGDG